MDTDPLARFRSHNCPVCDYDLRGLPESHRCPECGTECGRQVFVMPCRILKEPVLDWRFQLLTYTIMVTGVLISLLLAPLLTSTPGIVVLVGIFLTVFLANRIPRRVLAGRIKPDCTLIVTPSALLKRFRVIGGLTRRPWGQFERARVRRKGRSLQKITIAGPRRMFLPPRVGMELFFEASPEEGRAVCSQIERCIESVNDRRFTE